MRKFHVNAILRQEEIYYEEYWRINRCDKTSKTTVIKINTLIEPHRNSFYPFTFVSLSLLITDLFVFVTDQHPLSNFLSTANCVSSDAL